MQGIQIKKQPMFEKLYERVSKLVRPGWGYLNLSSSSEWQGLSDQCYRYVGALILPTKIVEDEKYTKDQRYFTGVQFVVKEDGSTLNEAKQLLANLEKKVEVAYLSVHPVDAESPLIDFAVRTAYHCQTLGVIPIIALHLPAGISLAAAQLIYLTLTESLNERKVFLQATIIETSLVGTHNDRLSLQNLIVLRRTFSPLTGSIAIRFDKATSERKDVFKLSFTPGIRPPWVIGFSLPQQTAIGPIQAAAFQCSGIE